MPHCTVDLSQMDVYRLLLCEHARKDAEIAYAKNPLDAENLSKWVKALLELSQFQNPSDSLQFVKDATSKLEEALLIHPRNHEILWCLGNAHISHALLHNDLDSLNIYFGKATHYFQQALEEDPGNEIYTKSLEFSIKLKLDDLVTELHALKRLYDLLQKNSTRLARPDRPSAHFLDEKSSHLLKKLLDVATQVLYSREKMISYTPEMPKSERECNLNPCENEKLVPGKPSEPENLAPVAELKKFQNPCPISEPACVRKLESKQAAIDNSNRCILSHTSELGSMRKPSRPLKKSASHRVKRGPSSKNGGELSLIPAPKHRQVEPLELLSQVSSLSPRKSDPIRHELTHHKRKGTTFVSLDQAESNQIKCLQPPQRSESQRNDRNDDRLAESKTRAIANNKHKKSARLNRSKARRRSSSSQLSSSSSSSSRSIPLPPSEPRTIHFRRRKAAEAEIIQKKDTKHVKPSRTGRSRIFSARSNQLTPTRPNRQKARKPPRNHLSLVPRRPTPSLRPTKAGKESEEEPGKFRRLKNKLSIIFHHHHHHHLHAREDETKGPEEARSLWKHLMAAFHLSSRSGKEEAAAAKGRHHGYLRVMAEGLLHHLWGMRWRRRKKVTSQRKSKKLRWWAWFRRKGGVVVGGRRRMRLRMGLSGSHRRIA